MENSPKNDYDFSSAFQQVFNFQLADSQDNQVEAIKGEKPAKFSHDNFLPRVTLY